MSLARLFRLLIAGLFTSAIIVGCASIPQSGQIGESDQQANVDQNVAYTFNPAGPAQDATQTSVINGFILAATGIQGDFSTAREFLTEDAAETWDPSAQTTIYTGKPIVDSNGGDQYSVELSSVGSLDEAGVLELADGGETQNFDFSLVQVNGQWRIDELPDGISLDSAQFRALFNTQTLYFYDPTYTYAVPDVRWMLNTSDQTAAIVQALLDGPANYLDGAVVSAFEQDAELFRDIVPVSTSTAQVDLTDETFADTSELTRHRMQQQLELALERYPGVSDVSMTRERSVIDLDEAPDEFTPADSTVTTGNTQVGIHPETQQLVAYEANSTTTMDGFPNVANLEPADPTMNRQRDTAAFVNADRDTLYAANDATQSYEIATGTDLIAPSMDVHDWVFSVTDDNTIIAAKTTRTGQVLEITHPWAGQNVEITSLRISPEGTRAAVVVKREDKPAELYLAGLIRDEQGQPQALGNTFKLQADEPPNTVEWYSTAEVLAGRVSDRERVELELLGFSGPSVNFKPMLGMVSFSTG
ncbi:MAG: LpqB family beta-propeller domain-containing protein, partial [Yaniella sp.]|nr:LpqB family beta-propeller domain-containing protein [Yaniella sp.]